MNYSIGFLFALAASIAPSTFAHGFLASIAIDGKVYPGNIPNQGNAPSPIRVIDDITPVKGATNRDINCGKNALVASMVAPAKPGSVIGFDWHSGENTVWPHDIGPMMTYMAVCGNTTCDQFDAINAEWFKIGEAGQLANNLSVWHQQDLFEGNSVNVTLPQDIAPGDYLIRHEIIALHLGNEPGGAEFYPSCSQIRIASNNGTVSQPNATVSLPGAYTDTDPGILVPTIFNPVHNYQFPGPPISNIVNGVNVTSSNATDAAGPVGPVVSSISKTSCPGPRRRRRQVSRIMRNFRMVDH